LKRSSRLIMLLGIILAAVAFVLVLFMSNQRPSNPPPGQTGGSGQTAQVDVVTVTSDVPLGDVIVLENLTTKKIAATDPLALGAFRDPAEVEGAVARRDISAGQVLTEELFSLQRTATNLDIVRSLHTGLRAMAIQVDQTTGVGTLVQPGDRVDVIAAVSDTDTKYPLVWDKLNPEDNELPPLKVPDDYYNGTSIKVLVQNVQVLGTLLPPPPEDTGQEQPAEGEETTNEQGTALTGQQQIVIVAVDPQQAELVRFAQLDGNLSIVMRSPEDKDAAPAATTGITLAELFTDYGVLKPELLEVILPAR
jgi:Flp pilus assembly protein CpaB